MSKLTLFTDSALMPPHRLVEPAAWSGHIPFAMWLVEQLRPNMIVELGTHTGNSYFALCQSVQKNGLMTHCYAVDTWLGDDHVSYADGDEIYSNVASHNQEQYAGFSKLLRMTFDEAVEHFSDGSIDLLHIDGLHTYEAVSHDFETWRSKLSPQSVVMFHDISERQGTFGVWRLWEELSSQYPSLSFDHSHGLGVIFTGSKPSSTIKSLLEESSSDDYRRQFRNCFERLGCGLTLQVKSQQQINHLTHTLTQKISQLSAQNQVIQNQANNSQSQAEHFHQLAKTLNERACELNETLKEMMTSRSWKITRPLRSMGRILRRLK